MTEILLLEGPDKNRYTATLEHNGRWYVKKFLNMRDSDWWKSQCDNQWYLHAEYSTEKLKETFAILAETKTEHTLRLDSIIHYD